MLEEMGIDTGIDQDKLKEASIFLKGLIHRDLESHLFKAGRAQWSCKP